MAESKHAKYIVTELITEMSEEFKARYAQFATRILMMDDKVVPGAFQMNCSWYLKANKTGPDAHYHDVPEIIGFFAEYSGLKWGLFMMTDFMEILIISCLLVTLFFGGWQVPWLATDGFHFPGGGTWALAHWAVVLLQIAAFNIKVFFFCWLQVLIRWTYPRFRYDQLMDLGWKVLIPLSLVNILGTGLIMSL